tara:strand:- start:2843 stop:3343 length:501 start_codon:yes stop_codon:yes gene_type:complete
MDSNELYNVTLIQDDGSVSIKFDGNVSVLEIKYRGKCSIHNSIPSKFAMSNNSNKIIMFILKKNEKLLSGTTLFKYLGEFKLLSCKAFDLVSKTPVKATLERVINNWELTNNNFEDLDVKWENMNKSFKKGIPNYDAQNNKFDKKLKRFKKSSKGNVSNTGKGRGY